MGGLIDSVPRSGGLIPVAAKQSSSATYLAYRYSPQTVCIEERWSGREGHKKRSDKKIEKMEVL